MTLSELLKRSWSITTTIAHGLGIKELGDILSSGGQAADVARANGLYGLFGFRDEKEFAIELLEIDREYPGYRDLILAYMAWVFKLPTKPDVVDIWAQWYHLNRWRSAFLGMTKSPGEIVKHKVTTSGNDADGKPFTKTEEFDARSRGYNGPRLWLIDLAKQVENAKGDKKVYAKIRADHDLIGIPYPPQDPRQARESFIGFMKQFGKTVNRQTLRLKRHADKLRKRRESSWWRRLIGNIFGN